MKPRLHSHKIVFTLSRGLNLAPALRRCNERAEAWEVLLQIRDEPLRLITCLLSRSSAHCDDLFKADAGDRHCFLYSLFSL